MKQGLINRFCLSPQAVHRAGSCDKHQSAKGSSGASKWRLPAYAGWQPPQQACTWPSTAGQAAWQQGWKAGRAPSTWHAQVCGTGVLHWYQGCSFRCRTKPWILFLDPATNATRSPQHPPHNLSKVRHILIQVFVVKRFHDCLLQKENSDNLVPVVQWSSGSNYHANKTGAKQQYVKKG